MPRSPNESKNLSGAPENVWPGAAKTTPEVATNYRVGRPSVGELIDNSCPGIGVNIIGAVTGSIVRCTTNPS